MRVICNCEGWKKSANQIFEAQIFASTHEIKYTGNIWKYCPWCSKPLEEEKTEKDKKPA